MPTSFLSRRACILGLAALPVSACSPRPVEPIEDERFLYIGPDVETETVIAADGDGLEDALGIPRPREIEVDPELAVDQILVDQDAFVIRHVYAPGRAREYPVGLGRDGLEFAGDAVIARKAKWPSWTPTPSMIERSPEKYAKYANGVPGGLNNPLGARALYLHRDGRDTYYRIHGTDAPQTIGTAVSNGCIRMLNMHVIELYDAVRTGTVVRTV